MTQRARDLGITVGRGAPGPHNAITDVAGVRVGHTTLISGDGPLVPGRGPVRTGVTVVLPRPGRISDRPVFAGCHTLNGNGELTGLEWIREAGLLATPVGLTTTHSVGVVRDALAAREARQRGHGPDFWSLPVVGETWDGRLNDASGGHVGPQHVLGALAAATAGPVPEGNVGGGTGMICHGFKGGIGTASRIVTDENGRHTVGVLVQANHGSRAWFTVNGVPVGELIGPGRVPLPGPPGAGSVIGIVATDAPLLPHQCRRLAQRAVIGIARLGAVGEHHSGDLFLAFATGNDGIPGDHAPPPAPVLPLAMLPDARMTGLFRAVAEATEEAVLNALLAGRTMTGRDGITAYRLPADELVALLAARPGGT
jgi:D-aminopeptidase